MKRQLVIYLSIALATVAIIILATSQVPLVSPNTRNPTPKAEVRRTILYSVTDLGTLGGTESEAYSINELGQVVGNSLTPEGYKHAFLWDKIKGMQDLDPDTKLDLYPWNINNLTQVVGVSELGKDTDYKPSFLWDGTRGMRYWSDRLLVDINDSGQIVGEFDGRATLWNGLNDVQNLGSLNNKGEGRAGRINNVGQVAGSSYSCQKWPCGGHGFFWDEETGMTDLGTLGSKDSWVYGINDLGQVVGSSPVRGGFYGERRAFLWDKTRGMQNLGTFDDKDSYARGINNLGRVVGRVEDEPFDGVAFLWDKTRGMQDLNNLIDPQAGWKLARAHEINERGWIVGTGWFNGNKRAFLLTPKVIDILATPPF